MAVLAKINLWKCQVYKIHDFCSGKFNFDGITAFLQINDSPLGFTPSPGYHVVNAPLLGLKHSRSLYSSTAWDDCVNSHTWDVPLLTHEKNRWIINSYRWLFEIKTFTSKSRSTVRPFWSPTILFERCLYRRIFVTSYDARSEIILR